MGSVKCVWGTASGADFLPLYLCLTGIALRRVETYLGEERESSRCTVLRWNDTVGSVKCVWGMARGADF